jgi:alpha-1,2-mannosyltransferase
VSRVSPVLERLRSVAVSENAARTRLLVIGAAAFLIVLAGWLVFSYTRPGWYTLYPTDLGIYTDGGLIVRHVGPPYDGSLQYPLYQWHAADHDSLQFTYTPFAAIIFAVVSVIPWSLLPRLVQVANLVFLLVAAWFTMDALGYTSRRAKAGGMLAGAAAGLLTEPVFRTMFLGQINLFLMALIIWDLRQPDRRWWKGIGTGIAAGIKLIPIVFVPYMLLARRFREAALTAAGAACTVLLGFVVIPADSADFWLHGLLFQDGRTGFAGWTGNQSLDGLVTRLAGSLYAATVPWAATVLAATVAGLVCAAVFDRAGHRMLAIVTTSLVGLLDSPISWDHHWVWVVPGMMVAAHYAVRAWRDGRPRDFIGCLTVAGALLLIFAPWPGQLWSAPQTGPGAFTYGLIWAGPYTPVSTYVAIGDKPWFKEYHWMGLQNLAGNAYILTGIAMLVILAVAARRMTPGCPQRLRLTAGRPRTGPRPGQAEP